MRKINILLFIIGLGTVASSSFSQTRPGIRTDGFYFTKPVEAQPFGHCLGLRFYEDRVVLRAYISYMLAKKPDLKSIYVWFNKDESNTSKTISGTYTLQDQKLSAKLREPLVNENRKQDGTFMIYNYDCTITRPYELNFLVSEYYNGNTLSQINEETFYFIPFALMEK